MAPAPPITTARLLLRAPRPDDAEDYFAYCSNPNVLRHTTGRTHQTIADTHRWLDGLLNEPPGAFAWALCRRDDPHVIGCVEFGLGDGRCGNVHYALAEQHWGQGFMTEAVGAVLDWAFVNHPALERIATCAVRANVGSLRVLEKCGMVLTGFHQETWEKFDHPVELADYAITRNHWVDRR